MDDVSPTPRAPSRRLRRIAITIGCVVLGVVGGLVLFVLTSVRRPPPAMTAEDFQAAFARWDAQRPANYEMQLRRWGRQSGTVQVTVENGQPIAVIEDGTLARPHTWEHWTVDGLFNIIQQDLEGLDQPERAFGVAGAEELAQQAEFDPQLGYPRRYRRAVVSTGDAIEWEITEFSSE